MNKSGKVDISIYFWKSNAALSSHYCKYECVVFHALTTETSETLDDEILSVLSEELNNAIGGNIFETDAQVTTDSDTESFTSFGFRYAISIGYNF